MQVLCLLRFPARDLGGTLITTSIALKNTIVLPRVWKGRFQHPRGITMTTNQPINTPLDELEAAKGGEKWGPQRITRGRRDVITAFVRNPSNSSVLLVKRSEKVNTYKLHWGGVSGVVEGDENLLKRAEQEVSNISTKTSGGCLKLLAFGSLRIYFPTYFLYYFYSLCYRFWKK